MGIYLVDYENVHNDGVTDIQKLSASDRVVIFYGDSIKSIPFETHVEMMASKAVIEYIETHKVAKNYLDFQLATYLGFLIGKGKKVRFTSSARIPGLTVLSISGAEETSKPSASQALLPLPPQRMFL